MAAGLSQQHFLAIVEIDAARRTRYALATEVVPLSVTHTMRYALDTFDGKRR